MEREEHVLLVSVRVKHGFLGDVVLHPLPGQIHSMGNERFAVFQCHGGKLSDDVGEGLAVAAVRHIFEYEPPRSSRRRVNL